MGWPPPLEALTPQVGKSFINFVLSLARSIHLVLLALLMNGPSAFSQLSWPIQSNFPPSRCICLRSTLCISTRAFWILLLIVYGCSGCSVVLSELRAILLLNGYQSLTMSWLLSSQLSTSMAQIIACFGQHVAWHILAFCALRNSPFRTWPVLLHPSILVWLISLWTPIHHPRAFTLGLKHLKWTCLGRGVSCI